jgi:hypothetical protein
MYPHMYIRLHLTLRLNTTGGGISPTEYEVPRYFMATCLLLFARASFHLGWSTFALESDTTKGIMLAFPHACEHSATNSHMRAESYVGVRLKTGDFIRMTTELVHI